MKRSIVGILFGALIACAPQKTFFEDVNVKGTLQRNGVEVADASSAETLTNKTIDADNNTISNLAHGSEVDDPSSGVHGVTGSVVGTTDAQALTNKDLDSSGLATNSLGVAVSNESTANLTALTRKKGRIYYDNTLGSFVGDDGASLSTLGGGSGSVFDDATFTIQDQAGDSLGIFFDVSAVTSADKTITMPDTNVDLADIASNTAALSGKATTELDNLGTTAINAHLLLGADDTYDIGANGGNTLRTVYVSTLRADILDSPSTGNDLSIRSSRTSPLGGDSMAFFGNASFKKISIFTKENTAADAQDTGDIEIVPGTITNAGASGNMGSVLLGNSTPNAGSGTDATVDFISPVGTDILWSMPSLDIGTSSMPTQTVYTTTLRGTIIDLPVGGNNLTIRDSITSPLGSGRMAIYGNASFSPVSMFSKSNTAADAQDTADVEVVGGDITNAGASGNAASVVLRGGLNAGSGDIGSVEINSPSVKKATSQTLSADDTVIRPQTSFYVIDSDSVTAADRTFTLDTTVPQGTEVTFVWSGNAGELLDTGNQKLSADWTPDGDDSITLIFDGTDWIELSRSAN